MFGVVKTIGDQVTSQKYTDKSFCIIEDMRLGVLDKKNTHYIEFIGKKISMLNEIKEGDLVNVKFLERAEKTEDGVYLNTKIAISIKKLKNESNRSLYSN